jgi:hypothetical protein
VISSVRTLIATVLPRAFADLPPFHIARLVLHQYSFLYISRLFSRLGEAAKRLAGRPRSERAPAERPAAMIGLPPSAGGLKEISDDIDEHAKDFSQRYYELFDVIARMRIRELGVPEDRIGMIDADNDFRKAAFHTDRLDGMRRPSNTRRKLD